MDKDYVLISVEDNGVGIEPDLLSMLFTGAKPMSQPGTEKEQGTGLGLILTREMIEKHGGKIRVRRTAGKGSVLSLIHI